jgi:hypothetical protein
MLVSASFRGRGDQYRSNSRLSGFFERRSDVIVHATGISEILTTYIEKRVEQKLIDILLIKKVNALGYAFWGR